MITVLFVMTWIGGLVVQTQEFGTPEACENARSALETELAKWHVSSSQSRSFCVSK